MYTKFLPETLKGRYHLECRYREDNIKIDVIVIMWIALINMAKNQVKQGVLDQMSTIQLLKKMFALWS
jgi:hypothetical protein